jgi:hypothetical protein
MLFPQAVPPVGDNSLKAQEKSTGRSAFCATLLQIEDLV